MGFLSIHSPELEFLICLFVFKKLFIFERASEHVSTRVGRGKQREGQNLNRFHTVSAEPDMGPELKNWEIMTRAEVGGLTD